MERGRSKDPGKQERLDNYKAQFKNGKKKWVRYDEGAILYSMGIHSFMDLANEAKAVYRIKRICLVNTEKLDEYIATLQEFRDEVLATHRAYSETVRVDADGNVMKSK